MSSAPLIARIESYGVIFSTGLHEHRRDCSFATDSHKTNLGFLVFRRCNLIPYAYVDIYLFLPLDGQNHHTINLATIY